MNERTSREEKEPEVRVGHSECAQRVTVGTGDCCGGWGSVETGKLGHFSALAQPAAHKLESHIMSPCTAGILDHLLHLWNSDINTEYHNRWRKGAAPRLSLVGLQKCFLERALRTSKMSGIGMSREDRRGYPGVGTVWMVTEVRMGRTCGEV